MLADWLGHVAKSAAVRNMGMLEMRPPEARVCGLFLRVSASLALYAFSLSECTNLHVSLLHFFGPPCSGFLDGLWK